MDPVLEPLIKRAAKRRKLKRVAAVAGGLAAAGVVAGGVAWSRKHPRDPKGRFRDTPDLAQAKQLPVAGSKDPMVQANRRAMRQVQGPAQEMRDPKGNLPQVAGVAVRVTKGKLPAISALDFGKRYPWVKVEFNSKPDSEFDPTGRTQQDFSVFKDSEVGQIRAAFHHFAQEYPETARRVTSLSHAKLEPGTLAQCAVRSRNYGQGKQPEYKIMFNTDRKFYLPPTHNDMMSRVPGHEDMFHRAVDMHAPRDGEFAFRYLPGTKPDLNSMVNHAGASPLEMVTLHELGHALHGHAVIGKLTYNEASRVAAAARAEFPEVLAMYLYQHEDSFHSRGQIEGLRQVADKHRLSVYAESKASEFFAEMFAWHEASRNKPSQHPNVPDSASLDRDAASMVDEARFHVARYERSRTPRGARLLRNVSRKRRRKSEDFRNVLWLNRDSQYDAWKSDLDLLLERLDREADRARAEGRL